MDNAIHGVIITGGTRGLGRALSLSFGRAGYRVLAMFGHDIAAANKLETLFYQEGIFGECRQFDLSTDGSFELPSWDEITLIHNATTSFEPTPLHQLKWDDFERQLLVALKGALNCLKVVLRPMVRSRKGTIINILSAALDGAPPKGFSAYLASKSALLSLTHSLASEYNRLGLRIFAVSPGLMDTSLIASWRATMHASYIDQDKKQTKPEVVASKILELARDPQSRGQGENYILGGDGSVSAIHP